MKKFALLLFLPLLMTACGDTDSEGKKSDNTEQESSSDDDMELTKIPAFDDAIDVEMLIEDINLDMDISKLSLSDIRILRNSFAAKQGYCFMKADLRAIFNTTTWYNGKMNDRYWKEDMGEDIAPISYSKEEKAFIEKLKKREEELKKQNLVKSGDAQRPNMENIVNMFQLEDHPEEMMQMLAKQGFAIVPNNHEQLFHVYEQNDYQQFPNFVTTDMYMQLFHMYFGYVLRTIEESKFVPNLKQLSKGIHQKMKMKAEQTANSEIQSNAEFGQVFYAVAYYILTDEKLNVPSGLQDLYEIELKNIEAASDNTSEFLGYTNVKFPYSLFKPRGHYTRNETLKKYFKAMMWLQTAPFCLDDDQQFKKAALMADILRTNKEFKTLYRSLLEPINFIIGLPDNVAIYQLADVMEKKNWTAEQIYEDPTALKSFRKEIKIIADQQNVIKPKQPVSCVDKINFIPQRYLVDNEVLQELVDVKSPTTKRGFPKGLDVMGVFGSQSAKRILFDELKEAEKWPEYEKHFNDLQKKMKNVDWNASLYNSWIKSLLELQKPNNKYPYFMQTEQWEKKDLNASLASWAELKHDAILYAEQPMGAECGGGGPPAPYTLGYVEPNVNYWNAAIQLLNHTEKVLEENNLMTKEIQSVADKMLENASFLLSASKKELAGQTLSEKEYNTIEFIGSTFEWLTLDLVKEDGQFIDGWENVKGPDKSVAVVADVYTANSMNNPNKGILHVATGNVNDIYVIVEIEGYLYLTKGAVFSYHEFPLPLGNRLTDEEWQEMLKKNQAPDTPNWIKEIIVPIEAPKANEKIFYSSGC